MNTHESPYVRFTTRGFSSYYTWAPCCTSSRSMLAWNKHTGHHVLTFFGNTVTAYFMICLLSKSIYQQSTACSQCWTRSHWLILWPTSSWIRSKFYTFWPWNSLIRVDDMSFTKFLTIHGTPRFHEADKCWRQKRWERLLGIKACFVSPSK